MKKKLLALMMIVGLIFTTSCVKDDIDEPTLTLSESEWVAPKASSEKSITVNTNQLNWNAVANADWIERTISGNTLTLKVEANPLVETRRAVVTVLVGGLGKDIIVQQAGSDVTIVTMPDKLEVSQWKGTYQFDVDANTRDWEISTDANWLKVTPKQFKGEVVIEVEENKDREARTATLTLTGENSTTSKDFIITQSGIMWYILPSLEFGVYNQNDIKEFELERRSETGYSTERSVSFLTRSPVMDEITYYFQDGVYIEAEVYGKTKEVFEDEEFEKFMEDNNFIKVSDLEYENTEISVSAKIIESFFFSYLKFRPIPKQDKDYPTFDKFPYYFTDFTADEPAIKDWEEKNGGTFNADRSVDATTERILFFDVKKESLLSRLYFIDIRDGFPQILLGTSQRYSNMNLCLFESFGELYVTKEFKELLAKEKFEYYGKQSEYFIYVNSEKNLVLAFRWAPIDQGNFVLDIQLQPLPEDFLSQKVFRFF